MTLIKTIRGFFGWKRTAMMLNKALDQAIKDLRYLQNREWELLAKNRELDTELNKMILKATSRGKENKALRKKLIRTQEEKKAETKNYEDLYLAVAQKYGAQTAMDLSALIF